MRLQWMEAYKVGVEPIDQQHERLVNMLNELQDHLDGSRHVKFRELVLELVSYTRYHFHTEETLMRSRQWPGYEAHKSEHSAYRARLLDVEQKLANDDENTNGRELETILVDFVKEHVLGGDRDTWIAMKAQGLV